MRTLCSYLFDGHRLKKLLNIRLWADDSGKAWTKNVVDMKYEILLGTASTDIT
jgi:hypothetical protein